ESGVITIGAMPLSRAHILPGTVTAFYRDHPDVRIIIIEGSFPDLIEPLRDGDIDLLIGALRQPDGSGDVAQRALFDDRPIVLGRMGHPLAAPPAGSPAGTPAGTPAATPPTAPPGTPPTLDDLARFPWVVPAAGTPLRAQWERMFTGMGHRVPHVPVECGSVITIRQILRDSDFLTILSPDQVTVELEAGWLTKIADTPDGLTRTIGVTTRDGWRPTAMQRAFIDRINRTAQSG
ncbi:MAG: LysR substrate-binding domain-containing protein, partial [Sphingopyxis sp.]